MYKKKNVHCQAVCMHSTILLINHPPPTAIQNYIKEENRATLWKPKLFVYMRRHQSQKWPIKTNGLKGTWEIKRHQVKQQYCSKKMCTNMKLITDFFLQRRRGKLTIFNLLWETLIIGFFKREKTGFSS